jgi:uncharacterized repeat protein (TIGR03833 family)
MNRPRNRQPRQGGNDRRHTPRNQLRAGNNNVPTSHQVVSGAAVSIVLKQDQPTGKEVQGVVQDLLSRGDHPRGIKVRLQDGRIGRVQRMASATLSATTPESQTGLMSEPVSNARAAFRTSRRGNEEDFPEGPPPRTLGDYLPRFDSERQTVASREEGLSFSSATIKCPICGHFEGDEAAVSHHIDEHLN